MSSVSGSTSSLSNSLRGYGGMASGLDRDALIEQMTLGTVTKINNVKKDITSTEWKQEAYRSLSDKVLDLQDTYFGYSATKSLTSSSTFAKNQVSTVGKSDVTQYITATGTSSMVDYLSIQGVKQLATSAVCTSDSKQSGAITTELGSLTDTVKYSNLKGTKLTFGTYNEQTGKFRDIASFEFPDSYKDESGKSHTIDYTGDVSTLVADLNKALKDVSFGDDYDGYLQLELGADGGINFVGKKKDVNGNEVDNDSLPSFNIKYTGSALSALGFKGSGLTEDMKKKGIDFGTFNSKAENFASSAIGTPTWSTYLENQKMSFTYGGQTKDIDLTVGEGITDLSAYRDVLQERINKAFGSEKIIVNTDSGKLTFNTKDPKDSLTIHSDDATLRSNLGISKNASNKISLDGTLADNFDKLGFSDLTELENALKNFTINGEKIDGLKSSMSVNDMLEKINNTTGAGVKASYLSGTNQFVLVATETGSGREIDLGGGAKKIFGYTSSTVEEDAQHNRDGQDALIEVSYGNGISTTVKSATNTFNLEGLKVTVTGTFGYKTVTETDENGKTVEKSVLDSAQAVSFSAKADVDGVTETVKKFIEEYNALIKEISTQMKTYPSGYAPLTDEQKDEMDETTIEKWEKKAKEGILFGDSTLRSLSSDMESIISQFMAQNGISTEQLEEMGISISDDYLDGGTLVFDESKFKEAMESDPESVSNVFSGGGNIKTSLTSIMEKTLTKYATRYASKNGNSYGLLIEEAGSEKMPTSLRNNRLYKELQDLQEQVEKLNKRKETEEDRYITMFTAMENAISNMNAQASYLSSLQG